MKLFQIYPQAPRRIQKVLKDSTLLEVHIGCSNSRVYKALKGAHGLYLKTQPRNKHTSFAHEVLILNWLNQKLSVPEVIEFETDSLNEYLLLSAVPGTDCVEAMTSLDSKRLVSLLAKGLRTIHDIDISTCPFDETIAEKLKKARYRVMNNLVNEGEFDEERQDMTPAQVLQALQDQPPIEDELVFSHGDYCLPNVLIHQNEISGFIDLDRAGISNMYNDLAIGSRSIRYNLGAKYEPLFFEYYGINPVDKEQIAYYRMVDELF